MADAWFADGLDEAALTQAYRRQAMRLHPDRGGDKAQFQAMKDDYERRLKALKEPRQAPQNDLLDAIRRRQQATQRSQQRQWEEFWRQNNQNPYAHQNSQWAQAAQNRERQTDQQAAFAKMFEDLFGKPPGEAAKEYAKEGQCPLCDGKGRTTITKNFQSFDVKCPVCEGKGTV